MSDSVNDRAASTLPEVRTSDPLWLERLASVYRDRETVLIVNDANLPIDPTRQTLLQMGRSARLSKQQWTGVLTALGMSAVGIGLLIAAIIDPEPTSKLGLMITFGSVMVLGGGFMAIKLLTHAKPPNVRVGPRGFELSWKD